MRAAPAPTDIGQGDAAVALEVEQLRKLFEARGRKAVVAVDGVSFKVARGETVGLLGPNGSGKTTTMRCASGLTVPTSGRVKALGVDVAHDRTAVAGSIGLLLEGTRCIYWRMTVRENLDFFAGIHKIRPRDIRSRREELIDAFGLAKKATATGGELSRGMQQKLSLACVLIRDPALLLLDEPTLGLDVETTADLRVYLRDLAARGKAVVVSTHDMSLVESICDRAVIVRSGRVIADDRVSNLLRLFRSKTLRVVVGGNINGEGIAAAVRGAAPLLSISSDKTSTTAEFAILEWSAFYALVRGLERSELDVQEIATVQSGMEEVFMRSVRSGELEDPGRTGEGTRMLSTTALGSLPKERGGGLK